MREKLAATWCLDIIVDVKIPRFPPPIESEAKRDETRTEAELGVSSLRRSVREIKKRSGLRRSRDFLACTPSYVKGVFVSNHGGDKAGTSPSGQMLQPLLLKRDALPCT